MRRCRQLSFFFFKKTFAPYLITCIHYRSDFASLASVLVLFSQCVDSSHHLAQAFSSQENKTRGGLASCHCVVFFLHRLVAMVKDNRKKRSDRPRWSSNNLRRGCSCRRCLQRKRGSMGSGASYLLEEQSRRERERMQSRTVPPAKTRTKVASATRPMARAARPAPRTMAPAKR